MTVAGDLASRQLLHSAKERAATVTEKVADCWPRRFAYADPPYLGCCGLYNHHHEFPYDCWDDVETHFGLIADLTNEYPDGWAMSLSSPSLAVLLPEAERLGDVRVAAWVKPFAVYKPNVNPAYAWEPVIFSGGRRGDRDRPTVRDWHSEVITLKKGLTGAKPPGFCRWILDLLGYVEGDELIDVFPGTGVMDAVRAQGVLI